LATSALIVFMTVFGGQPPAEAQSVLCVTDGKIGPCDISPSSKLTRPTPPTVQEPTKPNPARANNSIKGDLRGFFPGMSIAAFQEVLKKTPNTKCAESDLRLRCIAEGAAGTVDVYEFSFVSGQSDVLSNIKLQFSSSASFADLISLISNQYGVKPRPFTLSPSAIIFWNLADERVLTFSSVFGSVDGYELTLGSERLRHIEREAFEKEIRTTNPSPKF
jgi:hypothetical protein